MYMGMRDKDITSDLLLYEKHLAEMCLDAASQTDDQTLLRDLLSCLEECQMHRLQLFQAMNARGWYNPAFMDPQDILRSRQHLAQAQQEMQQTFSQLQGQMGMNTGMMAGTQAGLQTAQVGPVAGGFTQGGFTGGMGTTQPTFTTPQPAYAPATTGYGGQTGSYPGSQQAWNAAGGTTTQPAASGQAGLRATQQSGGVSLGLSSGPSLSGALDREDRD